DKTYCNFVADIVNVGIYQLEELIGTLTLEDASGATLSVYEPYLLSASYDAPCQPSAVHVFDTLLTAEGGATPAKLRLQMKRMKRGAPIEFEKSDPLEPEWSIKKPSHADLRFR